MLKAFAGLTGRNLSRSRRDPLLFGEPFPFPSRLIMYVNGVRDRQPWKPQPGRQRLREASAMKPQRLTTRATTTALHRSPGRSANDSRAIQHV